MNTFRFGMRGFVATVVALGVAGDALLRPGPLGANVTIYLIATLAVLIFQARRAGVAFIGPARVSLAAAVFFSVLYIWRDSGPTSVLILGVIAVSMVLAAASRIGRDPRLAYLWDYAVDAINFCMGAVLLPFVLMTETQRSIESYPKPATRTVLAVLRGILIAAPMVIVFGALLVSADVLFEQFLTSVFDFDFETMLSHIVVAAVCAWAAAAVLWQCLEGAVGQPVFQRDSGRPFRWGTIEINVALGIVTALFLTFIAVQVRYLFGGHDRVLAEAGLTYADYARRGFFELAAVAGVALALLINCSRLVETASVGGRHVYKVISACFIAAVLAIIASAFQRMNLYIDAYGLTRLRLYTASFMGWMVVVFIWLYASIYLERIRQFAWGLVLTGYAATFILLAVNPDALIARVNMARALDGKGIDLEYMRQLSADAIPPMVQGLPQLDGADQVGVRDFLEDFANEFSDRDYRTWTWGLTRAAYAMESLDDE